LAVLQGSKVSASPVGHDLIDQLGATGGLSRADVQNILRGLSSVHQVALSIRQDRVVLLVTGRAPDTILPSPEAGWKAVSLGGDALLIGHSDAVDQAFQRLLTSSPLSELASKAQERQADSEFWMIASAKIAGPEAVGAGVKLFWLTASMRSDLTSDTTYELNGVPEAGKIRAWLGTLADPKVEGNAVHVRIAMGADETRKNFGQIAASPLGQQLGTLIKSAKYLPVRDTATTVHTKPVIYGLDDGAREVKYVVSGPDTSASTSPAQPVTGLSGTWAFNHAEGRIQGTIVLRQTGSTITGTWHTGTGKSEPDSTLTGRVDGKTVTFTRLVGNNQTFVLTLSDDDNRLDGFGEGWFLNHTNLDMQRAAAMIR
jgi:ribosomal protein L27